MTNDEDISIEIIRRLKDCISETHIRECLPDKYKKRYRLENARQKNKGRQKVSNGTVAKH